MSLVPLRPAGARALVAAALLAISLASCGGPGEPTPTPSITIALADASADLVLGSAFETTLTLERQGGADGDVTLTVSGAPSWASVTLSPATLSGAATTSTITVETDGSDPDVAPADVTLTVTAAAGELSDSAELTLRVGLLKVRGKVTGTLGTPADTSGVVVSVNGGAAIPVEADGTFEGPEVAVPYDLVVAQPPTLAHVYRGLTTTDLTLELSSVGGFARSAKLAGQLPDALEADQVAFVCVRGEVPLYGACDTVNPGEDAYEIDTAWVGPTTIAAEVYALFLEGDGVSVVGFPYVAHAAVELTDGATSEADLTLTAGPAAKTVTVRLAPAPGTAIYQSWVAYHMAPGGPVVPVAGGGPDEAVYEVVLPDVPEALVTAVMAYSNAGGDAWAWHTVGYGSGVVESTAPAAPYLVAPVDGTTGVNHDTEFVVWNPAGGVLTYGFEGPSVGFLVTTVEERITIPDLSSLGVELPSMNDFVWFVMASPHHRDVDSAAARGLFSDGVLPLLLSLSGIGSAPPVPTGAFGQVGGLQFKTE